MSNSTSSQCTCNDETLIETKTCFKCQAQWSEPMPYHMRVNNCSEHFRSIAICITPQPPLCQKCKDDGYEVEMKSDGGWMPGYEVVKK